MEIRPPTTVEFFLMAATCAFVLFLIALAILPSGFAWRSLEGAVLAVGIFVFSGVAPFCRDGWPPKHLDDDIS